MLVWISCTITEKSSFIQVSLRCYSIDEPRVLCHTISMPAGFDSPVSLEMKHIGYEKPRDMRNILWDIFTHCCLVLYNTPDLIEQ
jgi:hypothetical protein